jgi:hypothetical protein
MIKTNNYDQTTPHIAYDTYGIDDCYTAADAYGWTKDA